MTEYIERGALLEGLKFPTREEIEKRYIEIEADQQPLDVLVDTMLAISRVYLEKVEGAPAADVEPVVRCRYCENGYIPKSDGSYVWCKMFNQSLPFDFYCKYAQEESINPCNECEHAPSMCGMDIADCAHMDERSDA